MQDRTPKWEESTSTTTSGETSLADVSRRVDEPSGSSSRSSGSSHAKRQRGVLVVESDPDLQWHLSRMLTVAGNRVVGTSSGDGALALMANWSVDVALVAEDLPGMDGIELSRQIGRHHPGVPVVLMADEGPDVELAAKTAGAAAWLVKPCRKEDLDRAFAGLRVAHGEHAHRTSTDVPTTPAPPSAE